jgi:hypothetical protein
MITTNYGFWVHPKNYMAPMFVSYTTRQLAEERRDNFIKSAVKVGVIREIECDLPQPIEHKVWTFFWSWHENPNEVRWTSDTDLSVVQQKRKQLIDGWPDQIWVGGIKCITDIQE